MSGETVVVTAAPETPTETPAQTVADAITVAETIMDKAAEIAAEVRHDENMADQSHEIIALISETRDDVRNLRAALDEIISLQREILAMQIVDVMEDELPTEPTTPTEPAAPAVDVTVATGDATVTEETPVDTAPPPAETRVQPGKRRWL